MLNTQRRFALVVIFLVAVITTGAMIGITHVTTGNGDFNPKEAIERVRAALKEQGERADRTRPPTPDEKLEMIAKANPGFGGFFRGPDDKSTVTVFMTDVSKRGIAERAARASVKDPELITKVRIAQADFEFTELAEWYRIIKNYLWVAGDEISQSGISEQTNRIRIGLTDLSARDKLIAILKELGIPENAVTFEKKGFVKLL